MTMFYPNDDDVEGSLPKQRLEILLEAAERYKAAILDVPMPGSVVESDGGKKRLIPRDVKFAYNWQEISKLMREIREMPETSKETKSIKVLLLKRLAEIYEVLRAAKMPKLEAVRIALTNEAAQLEGRA